jgi:hypothetical protein
MAWQPVLEILVYSIVLGGTPVPAACEVKTNQAVECTNGAVGKWDERSNTLSVNGSPVYVINGRTIFGNGMLTGSKNTFGWTAFNNGVLIRRNILGGDPDAYLINPDLVCETVSEKKAVCHHR